MDCFFFKNKYSKLIIILFATIISCATTSPIYRGGDNLNKGEFRGSLSISFILNNFDFWNGYIDDKIQGFNGMACFGLEYGQSKYLNYGAAISLSSMALELIVNSHLLLFNNEYFHPILGANVGILVCDSYGPALKGLGPILAPEMTFGFKNGMFFGARFAYLQTTHSEDTVVGWNNGNEITRKFPVKYVDKEISIFTGWEIGKNKKGMPYFCYSLHEISGLNALAIGFICYIKR